MRRNLESLFVRYRERGDLNALAAVFDRTASDLLVLAQHLVRNFDDAEDLVQATFVTAIDRADSYECARPLQPWLSGILAHHASNRVRERSRRPQVEPPQNVAHVAGPHESLERAEFAESVRTALGRLEPRYALVLGPYLEQGEAPAEIARKLELAPGTVRAQICRGLVLLRRMLPAGAAAAVPGTGLAGVRSKVLSHAGQSMAAVHAASSLVTLGGAIMLKKAVALAATALAGLWWFGTLPTDSPDVGRLEIEGPQANSVEADPLLPSTVSPHSGDRENAPSSGPGVDHESTEGRVVVEIELIDVAPEHAGDVRFKVAKEEPRELLSEETRAQIEDELFAMERVLGASKKTEVRDARAEHMAQIKHYLSRPKLVPIPSVAMGEVKRGSHGAFVARLDVSGAFSESDGVPEVLHVTASHDLYFDGEASVACPGSTRAQVEGGKDVVLEAEVGLAPAAVLSGVVQTHPEELSAMEERVAMLSELEAELVMAASVASEKRGEDHEEQIEGLKIHLDKLSARVSSRVVAAVLRAGGTEAVARATASSDGSFRLKLREAGAFRLIVVSTNKAVAQQDVELVLASETVLQKPIEFDDATRLECVVEDFGVYGDGGLPLEVTRISSSPMTEIEWRGESLGWCDGDVVRLRMVGVTADEGRLVVDGLSPGMHVVGLPSSAHCAFESDRRSALSTQVDVPSTGAVVSLPIAILDVRVTRPSGVRSKGRTRLVLAGRTESAPAVVVAEGVRDSVRVFAEPGQQLTLELRDPAARFDPWVGAAPGRGKRTTIHFSGQSAEDSR